MLINFPQIVLPNEITLTYHVEISNETINLIYSENSHPMYRMDLFYPFKPGKASINLTVSGLRGNYSIYLYAGGKIIEYMNTTITLHISHPYLALHIYLVLWKAYPITNNVKVQIVIRSV